MHFELKIIIQGGDIIEQTLVLIKPDGVKKKKIGNIITRFEKKGFTIQALKMVWLDRKKAGELYSEHKGKDFYERLMDYITECPLVSMVLAGENAIKQVRKLAGDTDPAEAMPGTIRGDFALDVAQGNILHAADSRESARREIDLFFEADEIYDYKN